MNAKHTKKLAIKSNESRLPSGVFSRRYALPNGERASVAYHTPSQSVIFFEGDSAEVWWKIFQASGRTENARDYILQNGTFDGDPDSEAEATLAGFIDDLRASNLMAPLRADKNGHQNGNISEPSVKKAVDVTENPELAIGQFMADHRILYSLVLELTYRCNEKCVHCYLPQETRLPELSLQQIDELMGEFASMGGLQIQLTGGEAFARKDIVSILGLTKKHGLVTSITTNLTLLNDDILNAIVAISPRSVGCSIYAARPELHDAITLVKGSFEKSVRAIRSLRAAGIPVIIKSPLMKTTAPHWREIEALAKELGCEYQFDLSITAKNDGKLSPLAHRVDDREVLNDIFSSRYYKLYVGDELMSTMAGPSPEAGLCGAGASGLAVSPDGTIRPCIGLNIPLGQWPKNSLAEVWHKSPFFAEFGAIKLRDISPCNACPELAFCSRCPGAWLAEHGDFRKPSPYTCVLARAWAGVQRANSENEFSSLEKLGCLKGGDTDETENENKALCS
jgi:radical SAM protein with 4Fe4S-binding SPASM domain